MCCVCVRVCARAGVRACGRASVRACMRARAHARVRVPRERVRVFSGPGRAGWPDSAVRSGAGPGPGFGSSAAGPAAARIRVAGLSPGLAARAAPRVHFPGAGRPGPGAGPPLQVTSPAKATASRRRPGASAGQSASVCFHTRHQFAEGYSSRSLESVRRRFSAVRRRLPALAGPGRRSSGRISERTARVPSCGDTSAE